MSNSTLKILALVFMTIDHIGYFLSSTQLYTPMRMIGRLSFPIFLFLIIQGYKHTSNVKAYMNNLFVFAFISGLPFYFAFGTFYDVFFTLGTIVLMLYMFDKTNNELYKLLFFALLFIISKPFDWGQPAILTVYLIHKSLDKEKKLEILLPIALCFSTFLYYLTDFDIFYTFEIIRDNNLISHLTNTLLSYGVYTFPILFAIPFLTKYNGKRGLSLTKNQKYGFYLYYPVHLIIIRLIFQYSMFI